MSRPFICVGDRTDHGGSVVSGSPYTDVDGKPVSRIGDRVVCPHHGPTTIVTGDATLIIDGQPVARHGDKTVCGATLISSQVMAFVDSGAAAGARGAAPPSAAVAATAVAAAAASSSLGRYDEAFILTSDETGEPLAHRRYRIRRANGAIEDGVTDEAGMTKVVQSSMAEELEIELEEEGP